MTKTARSRQGGAAARGSLPADELPPRGREIHRLWLLEVTQLPTAAGREWRVIEWIRRWVAERSDLVLREDRAGNLVIEPKRRWGAKGTRPVFITAHLDHPAFVVERVIGPGTVELAFRGGVMDEYFQDARVVIHAGQSGRDDVKVGATLTGEGPGVVAPSSNGTPERLFKTYLAEIDHVEALGGSDNGAVENEPDIRVGDVATWALPPAEIDDLGVVHTAACDDLAALAAALCAFDTLRLARSDGGFTIRQDVRLIFTRSEEIGFTGAIAACKLRTMPKNARVIALENSRSFPDSPIGGGPIVRVGDRMSIFSPALTAACAKRAEQIAGHAAGAAPAATQNAADVQKRAGIKWQRKLMAGGACEATVFRSYGYEATCICLPLGNYHNMANLTEVQAGAHDRDKLGPPRVGREYIGLSDFEGMVDLLVAIGLHLPEADTAMERIEGLYRKYAGVLQEGRQPKSDGGRGKPARAVAKGRGGKAPQSKRKPDKNEPRTK